ncbi:hypothetical protein [Streptomyces sp. YIM S03343]
MPGPLSAALVLVHALFVLTVLGGLGLLLTAAAAGALDGRLLALTVYGAAPGTLGWWLARRSWTGGIRTWGALVAVQLWLIAEALANLAAGSGRAVTQLLLPVVILVLLLRRDTRQWYDLPPHVRALRRPFSLARVIRWRRDDGQTSVEYAGLVAIVAALIAALLVSGIGTQIYGGLRNAVCEVTGSACPAPAPATGPAEGSSTTTGTTTNTGTKHEDNHPDPGCFSGVGAFFGCAGDQLKQVGEGLVVDGVWGDVTGIADMVVHPVDTLKGIGDYGKKLGHDWSQNSKDAGKKWSDGDYLGALWDWTGASAKTGGTVLYDLFIGDDVANDWNNGQKTRAVSHVVWNIGSLFIPGYDAAKVVGKADELGKLSKLGKLGKLAEEAAEAAEDAKKAAKAGDLAAAERAAKEAEEAAAEAEQRARKTGCLIGAPARRIPYDGTETPYDGTGTGTARAYGTTVLAAADAPRLLLAEEGCDKEAQEAAEEARRLADEADEAAGLMTKDASAAAKNPSVGQGDPKKFKDHFQRHKKVVEDALGTKYKKLGEDGPRFLSDIRENIKNGTFQLVGKGTLKKGEPEALIYRGRGVTIVLRENGDFWTALKTGEGLDTAIVITKKAQ